MRWTVHGERSLYESDWVSLRLVDVELPSGERFAHHVIRMPRDAAAVLIHDPERGVLLTYRHRFITDTWGYELPAGGIDPDETPEQAAVREALEETGWRPGPLRPLCIYHPTNGLCDQRFHVFAAAGATFDHEHDSPETERIEWVTVERLRELASTGAIKDGFSLTGVLMFLLSAERALADAATGP